MPPPYLACFWPSCCRRSPRWATAEPANARFHLPFFFPFFGAFSVHLMSPHFKRFQFSEITFFNPSWTAGILVSSNAANSAFLSVPHLALDCLTAFTCFCSARQRFRNLS